MESVRDPEPISDPFFWIQAVSRIPPSSTVSAPWLTEREPVLSQSESDPVTVTVTASIPIGSPIVPPLRSEEHTSELQSLMRISYAVFCLKKKTKNNKTKQS